MITRVFLLLVLLSVTGCSSPATSNPNEQNPIETTEPAESQVQTEELQSWTMITPGEDIVCANGSPYSYWVKEGDSEKLFVYFQGFNRSFFCNDSKSCSSVEYDDSIHLAEEYNVQAMIDVNADEPDRLTKGVFDFENPNNPLRDYTIVYVPICTGDLHWGNNLQSYTTESGETFEVYHQGYTNAESALTWAYDNLPNARQIFVSGCEVGAAGSILHTVSLQENYPSAQIAQLGEGYAGILPEATDYNTAWQARSSMPDWLNEALPEPFSLADLYIAVATHYPDINFAQFNYAEDDTQAINYTRQKTEGTVFESDIDFTGFTHDLLESLTLIHDQAPNFYSFTVYGEEEGKIPPNCAQLSAFMELIKVEDTFYADWLSTLVDGEPAVNVEGALGYEARK